MARNSEVLTSAPSSSTTTQSIAASAPAANEHWARRAPAADDPRKTRRPAFARGPVPKITALQQDLDEYLHYHNTGRVHTGRLTRGRMSADIVYGARRMGAAR